MQIGDESVDGLLADKGFKSYANLCPVICRYQGQITSPLSYKPPTTPSPNHHPCTHTPTHAPTHAQPSLPIDPNTNPTPPNLGVSALHYSAATCFNLPSKHKNICHLINKGHRMPLT